MQTKSKLHDLFVYNIAKTMHILQNLAVLVAEVYSGESLDHAYIINS